MTNDITDDDRAAARGIFAGRPGTGLFSHPAEPDELTEPATSGNHVAREGHDPGSPIPHDDLRQVARDLFSN